jgi:hypothetical protein
VEGKSITPPKIEVGPIQSYPVLLTGEWCPFTLAAASFWDIAVSAVGLKLRVLDAEIREAAQVMVSAGIAGVPCLIAYPGRLRYGLGLGLADAISFLQPSVSGPDGEVVT